MRLTQVASLWVAGVACAYGPGTPHEAAAPSGPGDSVAFSLIVKHVAAQPGYRLSVDPRPTSANPAIASISDLNTGRFSSAEDGGWADSVAIVSSRRAALTRLGIDAIDVLPVEACARQDVGDADLGRFDSRCAQPDSLRVAVLGLPRPGGPFLPGMVDERSAFATRDVWSVRVLVLSRKRPNHVQRAMDYVLEKDSGGSWQVLKVRPLLIVD